MKRTLVIPLIVFVLVSMSCSLFSPAKTTEAPVIETTVIVVPPEPAKTAIAAQEVTPMSQEEAPTEIPAPVEEPTQPEPTVPEPTATEVLPEEYEDTFDRRNSDWSEPLFVTTQASGRDPYTKIVVDGGVMRFSVTDKETYVYKFYQQGIDGDVAITIDYQNKASINSGIAVVCKADQDLTKWYEMRFTTNNGFMNFYVYDKQLKTVEGKNPYTLIGKTHLKTEELPPTKPNHLVITCMGNEITVDVNHGKKVVSQYMETTLSGAIIGLGAMSYDVVPVTVDYDTITITPK